MKKLLLLPLLASLLSLPSCAYSNAGIRTYTPITCVDKQGRTYQRMAVKSQISADLPGVATMDVDGVHLAFNSGTFSSQSPVYNRKGDVVNIITVSGPNGFYVSNVVTAQGNAFSKAIDSGAAAATGVLLSIGGAVVTGGTASALAAIPK